MPNSTLTRAAAFAPKSYDDKAHTIEVEVSTENAVQGVILSHARAAVDLSRFIGAPFLNSHKRGDARDVLGVVTAARIENRKLIASVKLTRREDAAGIIQDILDGITPQTSAGFTVSQWGTEAVDSKTGARTRTATRWRPFEVSVVPYAADETRVRSEPANDGATQRSNPMPKKAGAKPAPTSDADVIDTPDNEPTAVETRAEIREIIKRAGGTPEQADELIDADSTVEQARAAAYELMTVRSHGAPRVRIINPGPSPEQTRGLREEALSVRIGGGKPSDQARQFVSFSLVDHARDMLEAQNIRTRGMNNEAILTRAMHTVSDFPELLLGTGARLLKPAYEAASSPLVSLARKVTASDFRTQSMLQLGEMPKLQRVPETGEIKSVTRGEAKESWALDTYGSIFSLSRKALINDDLGAFADFATAAGQAAANTVADLLVTALTQAGSTGPIMGDGKRLFHVDHGNIDTLAQNIDVLSVSAARTAMMTQRGLDGQTLISVRPDTLIVAPSNLTRAEQFVASIAPVDNESVNPFGGKLTIVCEPRLEAINGFDWYLADSRLPALVLGGLAGNEGPQIASRDGFEVLGREFRVTLDVGVGPNEWRGIYAFTSHTDSNSAGT